MDTEEPAPASGETAKAAGGKFTLYVEDNFHYMDEGERFTAGTFATYEEALLAAQNRIALDFNEALENGSTATQWLQQYFTFGEDPWISPTPTGVARFSARDFARFLANREANGAAKDD